jgi:hypothetical protein
MNQPYRLTLDEAALRTLVADKVAHLRIHHVPIDVELTVPWNRMIGIVLDALASRLQARPPADPPEAREFLPKRSRR